MDDESGLVYMKARFYDPEVGLFLSNDPVEGDPSNPPSLHRYLYAFQNPTVYVDPDGRQTEENSGSLFLGPEDEVPEGYEVRSNRNGFRIAEPKSSNEEAPGVFSRIKGFFGFGKKEDAEEEGPKKPLWEKAVDWFVEPAGRIGPTLRRWKDLIFSPGEERRSSESLERAAGEGRLAMAEKEKVGEFLEDLGDAVEDTGELTLSIGDRAGVAGAARSMAEATGKGVVTTIFRQSSGEIVEFGARTTTASLRNLKGSAKKAKWASASQEVQGPGLRDHFEKHGLEVGAETAREFDLSARLTIQNGRRFSYRDRRTGKQRVGYWDPETGFFTATSQDKKTPVILTHFPETWEDLKKLPGFSSE